MASSSSWRSWRWAVSPSGVGPRRRRSRARFPSPPDPPARPSAARRGPDCAVIDRLVPCDGQQPGLEARLAAERLEPPERHQKRVLRGVLRLRMRAERREGGPIHRHPVPFDQLAKGGRVPLPGPRDQVDVAHRTVDTPGASPVGLLGKLSSLKFQARRRQARAARVNVRRRPSS